MAKGKNKSRSTLPDMFNPEEEKKSILDSNNVSSIENRKQKLKSQKVNKKEDLSFSLPSGSHAMAALGKNTEEVIYKYFKEDRTSNIFIKTNIQEGFTKLSEALKQSGWNDVNISILIEEIAKAENDGKQYDIISFYRWILSHPNDVDSVLECMGILPPEDINIIRVLPKTGSQKMVFLATWKLTNKQVVLKKFSGAPEESVILWGRETLSHPFSVDHPNIIETHKLHNKVGEPFMVEEKLPMVLNDKERSEGVLEAANLLFDIASALNHLHEIKNLVHGDVKPDNIGMKNYDYILLDFGICRKSELFSIHTTPSGSLRTRAPELLTGNGYIEPAKVDVWALGATVFNYFLGRFPLYQKNEYPPRIDDDPSGRKEFELKLKNRVNDEYDSLVNLSEIVEPLRKVLSQTLKKDPKERCTTKQLLELCKKELAAFIRSSNRDRKFSPLDEIEQLNKYLPQEKILKLMPISKRQSLIQHLEEIKKYEGLQTKHISFIDHLLEKLK